jgi:hypothetical protein
MMFKKLRGLKSEDKLEKYEAQKTLLSIILAFVLLIFGLFMILTGHIRRALELERDEAVRLMENMVKMPEDMEVEPSPIPSPTVIPTVTPTSTPIPTPIQEPTSTPTPTLTPEPVPTEEIPTPTPWPVTQARNDSSTGTAIKVTQIPDKKKGFIMPEYTLAEHKYYHVEDSGQTFNLDHDLQDFLYGLLVDRGREEWFEVYIAQLYLESSFNYNEISKTNDYGIAQINKCNHGWLKKQYGITDFLDPYQSIYCQVIMMEDCWKYGDVERALICYNRGTAKGYTSTSYSRAVLKDVNLLIEDMVEESRG